MQPNWKSWNINQNITQHYEQINKSVVLKIGSSIAEQFFDQILGFSTGSLH